MQTKTECSDVDQLIADYAFAVQKHQDDQTLKLVHQVLLISAYKIRFDPSQLPGQILGRLSGYKTDQDLNELLEQCLSPPQVAIIPSKSFMAGPNNLLSKSIIAHKTEIKSTSFYAEYHNKGKVSNTITFMSHAKAERNELKNDRNICYLLFELYKREL